MPTNTTPVSTVSTTSVYLFGTALDELRKLVRREPPAALAAKGPSYAIDVELLQPTGPAHVIASLEVRWMTPLRLHGARAFGTEDALAVALHLLAMVEAGDAADRCVITRISVTRAG